MGNTCDYDKSLVAHQTGVCPQHSELSSEYISSKE